MTIDELFLAYEKTGERQSRLIKAIGAAFGASTEDEGPSTPVKNLNLDQGPKVRPAGDRPGTENYEYGGGEISLGNTTAFGYKTVDKID